MQTIIRREELKNIINPIRESGGVVGFVPTMGALHEGHFSLIKQSLATCDFTVVSIFVNPRQFNNKEDFDKYPRQLELDLPLLKERGVDAVYLPNYSDLFNNENPASTLDLHGLDILLEGASRPGHFRGVVEVVYALLAHVNPQKLFLGLKDYQQVLLIKNMVKDLRLPIKVEGCQTQRAENGLALSSRNQRLSPAQQEAATVLFRVLMKIKNHQKISSPAELIAEGRASIKQSGMAVDYLVVVDAHTLEPLSSFGPSSIACVAASMDGVRLIDNLPLWDD